MNPKLPLLLWNVIKNVIILILLGVCLKQQHTNNELETVLKDVVNHCSSVKESCDAFVDEAIKVVTRLSLKCNKGTSVEVPIQKPEEVDL